LADRSKGVVRGTISHILHWYTERGLAKVGKVKGENKSVRKGRRKKRAFCVRGLQRHGHGCVGEDGD